MNTSTLALLSIAKIPHWVLWRSEPGPGAKPAKVPYTAITRTRASTVDSDTWCTWPMALAGHRKGGMSGLGFVLSRDLGLVFIDLDSCVDAGVIAPWAKTILARFDTYQEHSVSGTGVHLLAYGALPLDGRRKGHIEMYSDGRFVALTGELVNPNRTEIRDCGQAVSDLHLAVFGVPEQVQRVSTGGGRCALTASDADVLAKARGARNGAKFDRLWNGDTSDYNGDDSAADLALCSALAYWCSGDFDRVDRLFRQSALYREKWERASYREPTLARALRGKAA